MAGSAGVVLAGGLSSRMGAPKSALEWHGSTLLRRTVGIVARATDGPVVVVRASGQHLPELPPGTIVVDDPRPGKGPVQGIAAGLAALAALGGRPQFAFVSSTDLPFLHPAFVRRVLRLLCEDDADVALPVARGYRQPLAAGYRVSLAESAERLVAAERLRPAYLFDQCTVTWLDEERLRQDPVLAAVDPELDSVLNVNDPADYQAARARPAPEVTVQILETIAGTPGGVVRPAPPGPVAVRAATVQTDTVQTDTVQTDTVQTDTVQTDTVRADTVQTDTVQTVTVRAATVRGAAAAVGLAVGRPVTVTLNGRPTSGDGEIPLATGDAVVFSRPESSQGSPS